MTANEISKAILALSSFDDIRAVSAALKIRHRELQQRAAWTLGVGSKVQFQDKLGRTIIGAVTKINSKTVQVRADGNFATWRVTPSLLRAA